MKIPKFTGTDKQKVNAIAKWLYTEFKRVRVTPEQMSNDLFNRTVNKVIEEKKLCYNVPCADSAGVAAEALLENGIPAWIVLEKKIHKNGEESFHLSTEFIVDGKPNHLKVTRSEVSIVSGNRTTTSYRPVVKKVEIVQPIGARSVLSLFGVNSRDDMAKVLNGFDWKKMDRNFKKQKSRLHFRMTAARRFFWQKYAGIFSRWRRK
ncbi:MAG: hypothetical protein ABID38_01875 [Candidatus Diapherotrites archaeon]